MTLRPWILAARPKTLPAAVAPVLVATAFAFNEGVFQALPASICLVFALLIQIGTNFANDYFDYTKGADTVERIGPTRAVAAGLISVQSMKRATAAVFSLAFFIGLGLIPFGGWWLLGVGVLCIFCGYAYTAGPLPLAYVGLGDLFVILFFGVVAVCCTFFVQSGYIPLEAYFLATVVGGLSTNLLVVNNLRDLETDNNANKRTLAVRFGRTFTIWEFRLFILWSQVVLVWLAFRMQDSWIQLPLFTLPLGFYLWLKISKATSGPEFNSLLAKTALMLILYSILLAVGLLM